MKPLAVRPLTDDWDWQIDASCRGMDASVFFSPHYERGEARQRREQRAVAICRACPVRIPCASFAARTDETTGVWGGLTEADRRPARRSAPSPSVDAS